MARPISLMIDGLDAFLQKEVNSLVSRLEGASSGSTAVHSFASLYVEPKVGCDCGLCEPLTDLAGRQQDQFGMGVLGFVGRADGGG